MSVESLNVADLTEVTIPYPAPSIQANAQINGEETEVTSMSFSDKIMITITQNGRLAQWISVPLLADNPTTLDTHFNLANSGDEDALLPTSRFQPRILLGAGGSERETQGQLYASQIASLITTKKPDEARVLMLGLGFAKVDLDRDTFLQVLDLVTQVI